MSNNTSNNGLPEVTSGDNGKVLVVSNGEWAAKDIGQQEVYTRDLYYQHITNVSDWTHIHGDIIEYYQPSSIGVFPDDGGKYIVTFDDIEYPLICRKSSDAVGYDVFCFGDYDDDNHMFIFDNYPFGIYVRDSGGQHYWAEPSIFTQDSEATMHTVKIERLVLSTTLESKCALKLINLRYYYDASTESDLLPCTWNQIKYILDQGKVPFVYYDIGVNAQYPVVFSKESDMNNYEPDVTLMRFSELKSSPTYKVIFKDNYDHTLIFQSGNNDPNLPLR